MSEETNEEAIHYLNESPPLSREQAIEEYLLSYGQHLDGDEREEMRDAVEQALDFYERYEYLYEAVEAERERYTEQMRTGERIVLDVAGWDTEVSLSARRS